MRTRNFANNALVLTAFATVALIGFLCGIAADEKYRFQEWLKYWETLSTGALAIAAAFVTVAAMMRQDEKQQERHEQLLNLTLRGDAVKAQRASKFIAILVSFAERAAKDLELDEKGIVEIRRRTRTLVQTLGDLNKAVARVVGTRSLGDSYEIFDADAAYAFDTLHTASTQTTSDVDEWMTEVENMSGGAEKLTRISREARNRIGALGNFSRLLSEELQRLADTYPKPMR